MFWCCIAEVRKLEQISQCKMLNQVARMYGTLLLKVSFTTKSKENAKKKEQNMLLTGKKTLLL